MPRRLSLPRFALRSRLRGARQRRPCETVRVPPRFGASCRPLTGSHVSDCSPRAHVWARRAPRRVPVTDVRRRSRGRARARAEAEAAFETFRGLGAEPDGKAAETVLRTLERSADSPLTPRQTEVMGLIARGLTNREIAAQLGLSERTVDRHVSDILSRIDAPTRAAAAAWAVSHGLIGEGSST